MTSREPYSTHQAHKALRAARSLAAFARRGRADTENAVAAYHAETRQLWTRNPPLAHTLREKLRDLAALADAEAALKAAKDPMADGFAWDALRAECRAGLVVATKAASAYLSQDAAQVVASRVAEMQAAARAALSALDDLEALMSEVADATGEKLDGAVKVAAPKPLVHALRTIAATNPGSIAASTV